MDRADIFIADAHLKGMDTDSAALLLDFFDHIKGNTRTLFILGDLFDFYYGGKRVFFKRYKPVIDKLKELTDASVKLVYIEGNHDICMGSDFTDILMAELYSDHAEVQVDGRKIYLTHGDLMNKEDTAHIKWMRFLRGPIAAFIMKLMPGGMLLRLSQKLSKTSRDYSRAKKSLREERIVDELAAELHERGVHSIVFAHTHTPFVRENGTGYIANPGAFSDNGSYLRYVNGTFTLENFTR